MLNNEKTRITAKPLNIFQQSQQHWLTAGNNSIGWAEDQLAGGWEAELRDSDAVVPILRCGKFWKTTALVFLLWLLWPGQFFSESKQLGEKILAIGISNQKADDGRGRYKMYCKGKMAVNRT